MQANKPAERTKIMGFWQEGKSKSGLKNYRRENSFVTGTKQIKGKGAGVPVVSFAVRTMRKSAQTPKNLGGRKGYKVFSHTADVGLAICGKSLADLFENAAQGMMSLLTNPEKFDSRKEIHFHLRSKSWESLLVDWLHEILYEFTVKRTGFSRFKIGKIEPFSLNAVGYGETIDSDRHSVLREIKAVTYHDLKIRKRNRRYSTRIILDI